MLQALGAVAIVNHLQALESVRGVWVCFLGRDKVCVVSSPFCGAGTYGTRGARLRSGLYPAADRDPRGVIPLLLQQGKKSNTND